MVGALRRCQSRGTFHLRSWRVPPTPCYHFVGYFALKHETKKKGEGERGGGRGRGRGARTLGTRKLPKILASFLHSPKKTPEHYGFFEVFFVWKKLAENLLTPVAIFLYSTTAALYSTSDELGFADWRPGEPRGSDLFWALCLHLIFAGAL